MAWEAAPVGDGAWTGDSEAKGEELAVRRADGAGAVVAWLPLAASAI
jgi:hypothetical protein